MNLRALLLALFVTTGCARTTATVDAGPLAADAGPVLTDAAASPDAAPVSPDEPTELSPCSDAGPESFYFLASGSACATAEATLVWLDADRLHAGSEELAIDATDPSAGLRTLTRLPSACVPEGMRITSLRERSVDGHGTTTYEVELKGFSTGGMSCHATWDRTLTGQATVDARGVLLGAKLSGSEIESSPTCGEMNGVHPIRLEMTRACTP